MTDLFFSYSSIDRDRVRPAHEALSALGYDVFWDQEVPPGRDWDGWIREHLQASKCVLVFWSETSVASRNVRHEAARANDMEKLIPVMLDALGPEKFPMGFYTIQAANLHGWSGDVADPAWVATVAAIQSRVPQPDVTRLRALLATSQAELKTARARRRSGISALAASLLALTTGAAGFGAGWYSAPTLMPAAQPVKRAERKFPGLSGYDLYGKGQDVYFGQNGKTKDKAAALAYYEEAASVNYPPAMYRVFEILKNDPDIPHDEARAMALLRRSAEAGYGPAMVELATAYQFGDGDLKVDYKLAVEWYEKGLAISTSGVAAMNVGYDYDQGRDGKKPDRQKAAANVLQAVKWGYQPALDALVESSTSYSRDMRAELQKLLKQDGKYQGPVDGTFRADTVDALKAVFNTEK